MKNIKNLELDIIATYRDNNHQDHFKINSLDKSILKNVGSLIDFIKKQCDLDKGLLKLSLCWICSKKTVEKHKTIKESIERYNGKFYFLVDFKL